MKRGKIVYGIQKGDAITRVVNLSLDHEGTEKKGTSLAELRRERMKSLMNEAATQGVKLSQKDLSLLLLSSKATIKRDMKILRKREGARNRNDYEER